MNHCRLFYMSNTGIQYYHHQLNYPYFKLKIEEENHMAVYNRWGSAYNRVDCFICKRKKKNLSQQRAHPRKDIVNKKKIFQIISS